MRTPAGRGYRVLIASIAMMLTIGWASAEASAGMLYGVYQGHGCNASLAEASGTHKPCGTADPPLELLSDVPALTAWQGRPSAVLNSYEGWVGGDPVLFGAELNTIWNLHSVPMISWNPADMRYEVNDGAWDGYLRGWASVMKTWLAGPDAVYGNGDDRRAYLRLAWEMNGNWFDWMPAHDLSGTVSTNGVAPVPPQSCESLYGAETAFRTAWQRVHDIVAEQAGIDSSHLAWVFSVNHNDAPVPAGCDPKIVERLYPGDAYVDWVGIDGYDHQGTTSCADVFGPMVGRLQALTARPLGFNEIGTPPDGPLPKGAWITDCYAYARSVGARMALWFNIDKEEPWAVFSAKDWANSNGDAWFTYNNTAYHVWDEYKAAVNAADMVSADPVNPRLLSDAAFLGQ